MQTLSSKASPMDLNGLQLEVEQLWGEAVAAYLTGESWHIDPSNTAHAAAAAQWEDQLAGRVLLGAFDEALDLWLMAQCVPGAGEYLWPLRTVAGGIGFERALSENAAKRELEAMLERRGLVKHRKKTVRNCWKMTPEAYSYLDKLFCSDGLTRLQAAKDAAKQIQGGV